MIGDIYYFKAYDHATFIVDDADSFATLKTDDIIEGVGWLRDADEKYYYFVFFFKKDEEERQFHGVKVLKSAIIELKRLRVMEK